MKSNRTRMVLLALLCGTSFVNADILVLKNGTKVEGNILEQNDQGIRMKYRLTPKIMDEKVFPTADIAQVIKQRPEEVEVVELRKVLPTADLLKADEYEQIIQDRLRPFVNKYSGTPEAKEVEGLIATLQEEKTKVSNGQVKLEGKWLTLKESKAESFNVEAFRIVSAMRAAAAKQDYVEALREFDRLTNPRPAYTASTYYVQAIPEAIAILDKWIAVLDKISSEQPQLAKARKDGLTKLEEPELSKTKNAITDEYNKWRAALDAERRQKIRWTAPYKYELSTIQTAQKEAVGERTRLQSIDLESLKAQNDVFMACYRKIGEGDYTGGAAAFERVQALNLTNDYRDIPVDLRARLLKLYGQLVRANATGATATSGSAAIGGTATTGVDSRVAQILAEAGATPAASSGQPAAAMTAPAAANATTPAVAARPVAPAAPVQAAPAPAAVRPAVAAAPQQQAYAPPVAMPPPAPVEEESNLQLYIIIGMALVIVGLGVAFLKQQKKKED
jgi:hypothetical protein